MNRGSLRSVLLSSAAATMLIASAGTANAVEYNFGSVKVYLDTTLSAGVSMRTSETNSQYLPTSNGGPIQPTDPAVDIVSPAAVNAPNGTGDILGVLQSRNINSIEAPTVIAGSINGDDGRLNFGRWDLIGNTYKMTNDLQASWENYTFFARLNSYYDAVLASDSSYNRSALVDGEADAARDINLLDLYVSADYNVGEMPLNVRVGKQVISWGESTFLLNGVNSVNPIDVNAFRRPGAEIKEGLVPVWAIDASIGLPYNLSLEAFYQLQWDGYELDRPGTPFSTADVVSMGSGVGGNHNAVSFLTGGPGGNIMRNCSNQSEVSAAFDAAWAGNALRDCSATGVGGSLDYSMYNPTLSGLGGWPVGNTEAVRLAYGDTSIVQRDQDREPDDEGQYGIAARWYSEDLNNTEFGFYFMNYHSRLPIVSERVTTSPSTGAFSSYLAVGATSSSTSRGLPYQGCNVAAGGNFGQQPVSLFGVPIGLTAAQAASLNQTMTDPDGIFDAAEAIANDFYSNTGTYAMVNAPAGSPFAGGVVGTDISAFLGQAAGTTVVADNSILAATIINCALVANQSVHLAGGGAGGSDVTLATDGTEIIFGADPTSPALGLYLEYPEDIRMYGFSFNTTVGTWGVQGDLTYRPNQPVQLDTEQLTIAALNTACTFQQLLGPSAYNVLIPGATGLANPDTYGASCGSLGTGNQSADIRGYERTEIYTAQIGTTATYTASNPLVGMTGADLGILVTEVGAMYAPDAPEATGSNLRWGNVCTGGTDLPLGGFLSLASREGCRPTAVSWGYVLLGQLQYNNAFGTAVGLNPTIAWSHGVDGNSPAPLSNYRQGAKSISLQLNGSYQQWRGGISYTNYFGNEKYVANTDQDYVSMNISYAF
ncbi:DUF1302 family protein [Parvibaculum sp.]|uniref:DUF1302 domain-containing protein n=1 Tax=Parvibaculum sp. TaxID=2024848 RepID=UPI003BABFB66